MKILISVLFIIVIIFLLINNKNEHYKNSKLNSKLNFHKYYENLLHKYKDSELISLEIDKLIEYLQCKLN